MWKAATHDRWNHTAILKQQMINSNVEKGNEVDFRDCHPLLENKKESWETLKRQLFKDNGVRSKH